MKTQLASGFSMEYESAGAGPVIVFLHAFPLAKEMWRKQAGAFGDFRLITPNLRGFGASDGFSQSPSIDQMADDVAELLDTLKIGEPVSLLGLSMGGYVALAFARRHASRLRSLVLADTRAEADSPEARAGRDKMIAFAQSHSARDVIDELLPKMLSEETRTQRPEVVEEVRQIASSQRAAGIVGALTALRDRPDATSGLAAIRVPTLVLVGQDDAITTPNMAAALTAGIAGARMETIPGAGHLSNMERPEPFNAAVRAFLGSL